jgi:protease IV
MYPQPPPGQGPIDPRGAFNPPTPPGAPGVPQPAPMGAPLPPHMMSSNLPPQMNQMPPNMMPQMPPPPNFMMPPPMFMPPPPKQGGGFARSIFTVLATTILGLSLTLNVYLILTSVFVGGSSGLREGTVADGDPTQKIAIIPLIGLIDQEASQQFDRFMRTAQEDEHVKGIVIHVDSPGGTVSASDEIYHRIQDFKLRKPNTPVVVSQAGLAASGGYYVSCAADYILAQPTTLTGNIGVLMPRYNVSKFLDEHGVEETTITSTGATYKNAGSMFKPTDPVHDKYLQDLADKAFDQFKTVVRNGRKYTSKEVNDAANGKIYTATDALQLKLIDKIGYLEDAYKEVATRATLSNPTIVRYQNPPTFFDILSSQSTVPNRGAATNININGIKVDSKGIADLMTPRLMYLWRGE